jgi:hypothetical protein
MVCAFIVRVDLLTHAHCASRSVTTLKHHVLIASSRVCTPGSYAAQPQLAPSHPVPASWFPLCPLATSVNAQCSKRISAVHFRPHSPKPSRVNVGGSESSDSPVQVAFQVDRPSPATGRLSLSGVSNLKGESVLRREGLSAPWHKRGHSCSHRDGPGPAGITLGSRGLGFWPAHCRRLYSAGFDGVLLVKLNLTAVRQAGRTVTLNLGAWRDSVAC